MSSDGTTLYVQPGSEAYHKPYLDAVNKMQGSITYLKNDPNLYAMFELDKEMASINNQFDHLKLDEEFLHTSPNWKSHFRERELVTQKQAVLNTEEKYKSSDFEAQYQHNMSKENIYQLEANQFRENQEWAKRQLQGLRNELAPIANASHQRIRQFCDYIGVTDRYHNYRNNLNSRPLGERLEGVYKVEGGPPMEFQRYYSDFDPIRSEPARFNLPREFQNAKSIGRLAPPGTPSFGKKCCRNRAGQYVQEKLENERKKKDNAFNPYLTEYKDSYDRNFLEQIRDVNVPCTLPRWPPNEHSDRLPSVWIRDCQVKPATTYQANYIPCNVRNHRGPWDPPKPFGL